jgi:hypothetical protein
VIADSVGGADGVMLGDARPHDGTLVLDGANDYVQLPRQLLSSLRAVTLLVWLEWQGGDCWQRVFEFGLRHTTESGELVVDASLFLTIQGCPAKAVMIGARMGAQEERIEATMPTPSNTLLQVGLVLDSMAHQLRLVINGRIVAERDTALRLSALRDEITLASN